MVQTYQDRNSKVQCPYEPSHLIKRSGLAEHISKCSKNHPGTTKIRCPFDATHIIDSAVLQHHVKHCESSGSAWNAIYTTQPEKPVGNVSLEEACANQPLFLNEDWEGGHSTYDPVKHTEDRDIIRVVQCLSKKERDTHKLTERRRRAALEKHDNDLVVPKAEKEQESDAPLRRPKTMSKSMF